MTYMATPLHKNPCPRGHEIYNFGRPFLGHHYYILGLSDLCLGVETKIFKEIMYFHYITIWPRPCTRTPAPGVMKFTILVDPSFVIITIHLVCMDHAPVQRRIFYEIHQFFTFYPKLPSLGVGVMKFTKFLSPNPTDASYQIWLGLVQ